MIAALDVHYSNHDARAAAVVFDNWESGICRASYVASVSDCGDYSPGDFYLRELQPLLMVISKISEDITSFVIDGYCHLSSEGMPGLGVHLANSLPSNTIVVGVAKNRFRSSVHAIEVLRGGSKRPLFVTSIGVRYAQASQNIKLMHGSYRFPTLLKQVDGLSRH